MADITPTPKGGNFLKQQYGPMPGAMWLVVIGGSLLVAYYLNGKKKTAAVVAATPVIDTSGTSGVGSQASGWAYNPPAAIPAPAAITTDQAWGVQAINGLIAQNYPAALADSAIRNYLSVQPLNPQEQQLVNIALAKYGAPPESLGPTTPPIAQPPIVVGGTPAPPPPTPVTAQPAAIPYPYLWPGVQDWVNANDNSNNIPVMKVIGQGAENASKWVTGTYGAAGAPQATWLDEVGSWLNGLWSPVRPN